MKRATRFAAAFALLTVCAASARAQAPTLVFLVRHGEKAAQPANDPPLTPAGEERARALANTLANAGIGAVISTPYVRTLSTAKPVADKFGVRVDTVAIAGGVPAHAQAVAAAVRARVGNAVLVVGHSNTIPAIVAALGGPTLPDLCDGDYDQLFVVELVPGAAPRVMRSRYGAAAADANCKTMSPQSQRPTLR